MRHEDRIVALRLATGAGLTFVAWMAGQCGFSDLGYAAMFQDMRAAAEALLGRQAFFRI